MNIPHSELVIASLNIQGQTGFSETKQKQIEDFIKIHNIDILNCQEDILSDSFKPCH